MTDSADSAGLADLTDSANLGDSTDSADSTDSGSLADSMDLADSTDSTGTLGYHYSYYSFSVSFTLLLKVSYLLVSYPLHYN